jgi:hypothetical protein
MKVYMLECAKDLVFKNNLVLTVDKYHFLTVNIAWEMI